MGRVSGLHGVRGWVRVFSYTQPREGIVDYDPLYLNIQGQWRPQFLEEGCFHGKGVIAKFLGCDDRDSAMTLMNCAIAVRREQLPSLGSDEYYWADLEGLRVVTVEGIELGVVNHLFETGANDVVVVSGDRERLIPFIREQVIVEISLEKGFMRVDWDPAF
jgi:16S rRNA processing protein RimM